MDRVPAPQDCPERGLNVTCNEVKRLFVHTHDELRTASNPHVVGGNCEDGVALKKRRAVDGSVTKRKGGVMDYEALKRGEGAPVDVL